MDKRVLPVRIDGVPGDSLPHVVNAHARVLRTSLSEEKLRDEARHQLEARLQRLALVDYEAIKDTLDLCTQFLIHPHSSLSSNRSESTPRSRTLTSGSRGGSRSVRAAAANDSAGSGAGGSS